MAVLTPSPVTTAAAVEKRKKPKVWTREIVNRAIVDSLIKLNPLTLYRNPIMFIVEIGALLTTVLLLP